MRHRNSPFQKTYFTIRKIIQIVYNVDDFTMKEPYEAALPGVFHGALHEKAWAGRNGRPFLPACMNASRPLSRVAAGRKRAAIDCAAIFRPHNSASACGSELSSRRQALRFPAIKARHELN
jgi:hypothetical protein